MENKVILVGVFGVIFLALGSCASKNINIAPIVNTPKTKISVTASGFPSMMNPINIANNEIQSEYAHRKQVTDEIIYLKAAQAAIQSYDIDHGGKVPSETPDGCLSEMIHGLPKDLSLTGNAMQSIPNDSELLKSLLEESGSMDSIPTGACPTGALYHVVLQKSGGYTNSSNVLAFHVTDKGLANFDASKWNTATVDDFEKASDNYSGSGVGDDQKNWYRVFY